MPDNYTSNQKIACEIWLVIRTDRQRGMQILLYFIAIYFINLLLCDENVKIWIWTYLCDFSFLSDKMLKLYMELCLGTKLRPAPSGTL